MQVVFSIYIFIIVGENGLKNENIVHNKVNFILEAAINFVCFSRNIFQLIQKSKHFKPRESVGLVPVTPFSFPVFRSMFC